MMIFQFANCERHYHFGYGGFSRPQRKNGWFGAWPPISSSGVLGALVELEASFSSSSVSSLYLDDLTTEVFEAEELGYPVR